jgi:hypothetical protein
MRFVVSVLALVSVGGVSSVLADPPAEAPAPTSTAAAAPAAAVAPAAASAAAAPAQDPLEKHFLAEGYRVEMRGGKKMFCRREELLGSHLGGQKVCSTGEQLKANEAQAKELVERTQRQQVGGPSGR